MISTSLHDKLTTPTILLNVWQLKTILLVEIQLYQRFIITF